MKKLLKKLSILLTMITFLISFNNFTILANETQLNSIISYQNITYQQSQNARIPNIFSVEIVQEDKDHVHAIAHNIGIDTIDKISCDIKITNKKGLIQYNKTVTFKSIKPLFSPTHKIFVENWSTVEVTNIQCWDGSDYATSGDITLKYKEK